jgi:4-amino-4-deoxy-L-arabinose transferase-like glycosyltransferase
MRSAILRILNSRNIVYIVFCIAVLPVLIFRDFTPDNELRYLSIADEALRNGTLFTFTNHGVLYADKPPLYLWIVMLGKVLWGTHSMFFLSLFSVIPALVILYVMDKWVGDTLSSRDRRLAQLMLITSGYFLGAAAAIRMDMLMCMFIVLSLYTFFKIYSGNAKKRDGILFPLYLFLALFSKGPVGLMVPLVSIVAFLALKREIRSIGRYWGWKTLSILFLLSGGWFACVYAEGGKTYLNNLLFHQTINRAVNSFHHKEPWWYYLKTIWYSLAPWALLYFGVLIAGLKKRLVSSNLELLFLTVALSTFVMLSLFSSKLEIYMLPAFPFFAYTCALWLSRFESQSWTKLLVGIPAGIFCLVFPAWYFIGGDYNLGVPVAVAAAVFSVVGIVAIVNLLKGRLHKGIAVIGIGMLAAIFVASFAVPALNAFIGRGELCRQVEEVARSKGIKTFYSFKLRRVENADVYLNTVPIDIPEGKLDSSVVELKKPAILLVRQRDVKKNSILKRFIAGKQVHQVGDNCYIIL